MDRVGTPDVGDAGLGEAEKSYLSLLDEITYRAGHLLDRHRPIHAMLIEQIDVVGAKPPQRALDRFPDMRGPAGPNLSALLAPLRRMLSLVAFPPLVSCLANIWSEREGLSLAKRRVP